MTKAEKVLLVLSLLFLLILLGEGAYYFLYLKRSASSVSRRLPQATSAPTPSPTPMLRIKRQGNIDYAINLSSLESIADIRRGILVSSVITNQYTGKIIELTTKEGVEPTNNFRYSLRIKLEAVNKNTNVFWFGEDELPKLEIVKRAETGNTAKLTPIAVSQLAIGDTILLTITLDLTKDAYANLRSAQIIKLP